MRAISIFVTTAFLSLQVMAVDVADIIKKADNFRYIPDDISFTVEVTDKKASEVQNSRYRVFSKGSKYSRVETTFPERQAGRKLLMRDDDLWFYTPDIKRPTRVSMQQKLTGEVANGDIARTNFAEDYNGELKGEEKVNNVAAYKIYLTKKRDGVTYPAIDYWVAKSDFRPLKATFKTDSGKNLKTAIYKDPKKTLGRNILSRMDITSEISKNQQSILIFKNYKKETLDESFFNKESLNN